MATGSFRDQTKGLDYYTTQKIEQAFFNTLDPIKNKVPESGKRKESLLNASVLKDKKIVLEDLIS